MPVYFIAQVQINDQAGYQAYQEAAAKAPFEGVKVLAMDDKPEVIEGKWAGPKTVILEFESEAKMKAWYDSPAYQAAARIRWKATDSNVVMVRGLG
jgi:uncharacterized protein (DUF1330 family)